MPVLDADAGNCCRGIWLLLNCPPILPARQTASALRHGAGKHGRKPCLPLLLQASSTATQPRQMDARSTRLATPPTVSVLCVPPHGGWPPMGGGLVWRGLELSAVDILLAGIESAN